MFLIFRKKLLSYASFLLLPEEYKHAKALRLKGGDKIYVGDGLQNRWEGYLSHSLKEVKLQEPLAPYQEKLRVVCMAIPERFRLERFFLPTAVELGMTHFIPILSQHSVSVRRKLNYPRTNKIILESASQSQRYFLPHILNAHSLDECHYFLDKLKLAKEQRIVLDPRGSFSLSSLVNKYKELAIAIFIGPEGGFSKEEIQTFQKQYYSIASFRNGKNILRISTAAIASLAYFN